MSPIIEGVMRTTTCRAAEGVDEGKSISAGPEDGLPLPLEVSPSDAGF